MDGFNIRIKRDCFDCGLLLHNLPPLPEKPQSDDVIHTIRHHLRRVAQGICAEMGRGSPLRMAWRDTAVSKLEWREDAALAVFDFFLVVLRTVSGGFSTESAKGPIRPNLSFSSARSSFTCGGSRRVRGMPPSRTPGGHSCGQRPGPATCIAVSIITNPRKVFPISRDDKSRMLWSQHSFASSTAESAEACATYVKLILEDIIFCFSCFSDKEGDGTVEAGLAGSRSGPPIFCKQPVPHSQFNRR